MTYSLFVPLRSSETIGVESRDNLVQETNKIAGKLGSEFRGLSFLKGDIQDYFMLDLPQKKDENETFAKEVTDEKENNWDETVKKATKTVKRTSLKSRLEANKMDILIALHACDTATDDAIWSGIQGGAQIIGEEEEEEEEVHYVSN